MASAAPVECLAAPVRLAVFLAVLYRLVETHSNALQVCYHAKGLTTTP